MWKKAAKVAVVTGVAALVAAQFFRPTRENPISDPAASFEAMISPPRQTAAALKRACGDCHSNDTVWPWYSNIAPVSWVVAQDVREGRAHLNLSEWNRYGPNLARSRVADMCAEVSAGEMPLPYFAFMHPESRLDKREVALLCALPVHGAQN